MIEVSLKKFEEVDGYLTIDASDLGMLPSEVPKSIGVVDKYDDITIFRFTKSFLNPEKNDVEKWMFKAYDGAIIFVYND